ncbi:C39 family peptidase [Candidatus Riflebacteria bacterium]
MNAFSSRNNKLSCRNLFIFAFFLILPYLLNPAGFNLEGKQKNTTGEKRTSSQVSGAAIGAVIGAVGGTLICPPLGGIVGYIAGAAVGNVVGRMFGDKSDETTPTTTPEPTDQFKQDNISQDIEEGDAPGSDQSQGDSSDAIGKDIIDENGISLDEFPFELALNNPDVVLPEGLITNESKDLTSSLSPTEDSSEPEETEGESEGKSPGAENTEKIEQIKVELYNELLGAVDQMLEAQETYLNLLQMSKEGNPIPERSMQVALDNYLEKRGKVSVLKARLDDLAYRQQAENTVNQPYPTGPDTQNEAPATPNKSTYKDLKVGQDAFINVNTRLNFRDQPWGKIKGKLFPGEKVKILAFRGDWAFVEFNGYTGYVHADYLVGDKDKLSEVEEGVAIDGDAFPSEGGSDSSQPVKQVDTGAYPKIKYPDVSKISGKIIRMPIFNQNDSRLGRFPKGYCGPTTMQMIFAHYGVKVSRDYLALKRLPENGNKPVYEKGTGSYWPRMSGMAKHLGFKNTYITHGKSLQWLKEMTSRGQPVVVGVKGSVGGAYRTNGHITVVTGVDDQGNVYINDSAGGKLRKLSASNFMQIWSNSHNRIAMVMQK